MKRYLTGFKSRTAAESKERQLPQIDIAGTLFLADIEKLEFREMANPANRMPMLDVKEEMGFSHFFYDTETKNHYAGPTNNPGSIPDHVRIILLPPLKDIDPIGLSRRYGVPEGVISLKQQVSLTNFSKEKQTELQVKRKGRRL